MIRTELRILVKKYCSVEDHLGFVFFGGQPDMFRVEGGRVQLSEPKMWVGIEMSPGRAATRMTGQQKKSLAQRQLGKRHDTERHRC